MLPATPEPTATGYHPQVLTHPSAHGYCLAEAAGKALAQLPAAEGGKHIFFREACHSEVSNTSDASTEAPPEKRQQDNRGLQVQFGCVDTAANAEGAASSISSPPNEEAIGGETTYAEIGPHAVHAGYQPIAPPMQEPAPTTWFLDSGELIVKNTFIQFSEDHTPLRAVRTAAGRLDLMG
uniref:Uncharacterized protein n=1 Tax=Alexandrium catenella TaxID=2925 RepID=A0A7S1L1C3_ALECA|mmetsp:Transcript_104695/g.278559  ORF Transcript_104695/g.278559 Transcript_104695/m.278559 type:complete len:180 (+) Transcript_104695:97-636(+)